MRTNTPAPVGHHESAPSEPRITRRLDDEVAGRPVWVVAAAWLVGLGWLLAVTPPPDPEATPTMLDALVQSAMLVSWLAVIAGLAARRRWGFVAGTVGGIVLAGAGVLCLVTGHTGAWIGIQIGVGVGLAALSYRVLRLA